MLIIKDMEDFFQSIIYFDLYCILAIFQSLFHLLKCKNVCVFCCSLLQKSLHYNNSIQKSNMAFTKLKYTVTISPKFNFTRSLFKVYIFVYFISKWTTNSVLTLKRSNTSKYY